MYKHKQNSIISSLITIIHLHNYQPMATMFYLFSIYCPSSHIILSSSEANNSNLNSIQTTKPLEQDNMVHLVGLNNYIISHQ